MHALSKLSSFTSALALTLLMLCAHSQVNAQTDSQTKAQNSVSNGWQQADPASEIEVDHRPMGQILALIEVKERNKTKIAYTRLAGRALDYAKAYIKLLESVPVSKLNRDEQLAYWLNLHNINVITLIAENRNGHKKVKNYRGTPTEPGELWSKKMTTVEGRALSLQDIEQNILLQHWPEPNTLYGIYYGVQGSPAIGKTAFSGKKVHQQLEQIANKFINSDRHIKAKRKGLEISKIYEWNKATVFNNDDQEIINHLRAHAEPKLRSKLASSPDIAKYKFDWKSIAFIPRAHPTSLGNASDYRGAGS